MQGSCHLPARVAVLFRPSMKVTATLLVTPMKNTLEVMDPERVRHPWKIRLDSVALDAIEVSLTASQQGSSNTADGLQQNSIA